MLAGFRPERKSQSAKLRARSTRSRSPFRPERKSQSAKLVWDSLRGGGEFRPERKSQSAKLATQQPPDSLGGCCVSGRKKM